MAASTSPILLLLMIALCDGQFDPCIPLNHFLLTDSSRSAENILSEADTPLCDNELRPGWYKLELFGKPAEIPTKCIQVNRCGTQAPIWLNLRGRPLPDPGKELSATACTTWGGGQGGTQCCLFSLPIEIKNCGKFYVYQLHAPMGCNMAFCMQGARKPCGPGLHSEDGFEPCQRSYPQLEDRPLITPDYYGQQVVFVCQYSTVDRDFSGRFEVTWWKVARSSGSSEDKQLKREETQDFKNELAATQYGVRVGDTVRCDIRTFYIETSAVQSSVYSSQEFHLGLVVQPSVVTIKEDGIWHNVSIFSTMPLVCENDEETCSITVLFRTRTIRQSESNVPDIVLRRCSVVIRSQNSICSNSGMCAVGSVHMKAVEDMLDDDETVTIVESEMVKTGSSLWKDYKPPRFKIVTKDVPSAQCYSFTDPHYITFDRRKFDFFKSGTFVLYKSLARDSEVHLRSWICSERPHRASCNCGFVVKDESDVVAVDMCNAENQTAAQRPVITVKSGSLRAQTRILQARNGKVLTIVFPSGFFIRSYIETWGMSIAIQSTSSDFGHTRGLCGIFDGDPSNDLHDRSGKPVIETEGSAADEFVERWRLLPGESLFDFIPDEEVEAGVHQCDCSVASDDVAGYTEGQSALKAMFLHHTDITFQYANQSSQLLHTRRKRSTDKEKTDHEKFLEYVARRKAFIESREKHQRQSKNRSASVQTTNTHQTINTQATSNSIEIFTTSLHTSSSPSLNAYTDSSTAGVTFKTFIAQLPTTDTSVEEEKQIFPTSISSFSHVVGAGRNNVAQSNAFQPIVRFPQTTTIVPIVQTRKSRPDVFEVEPLQGRGTVSIPYSSFRTVSRSGGKPQNENSTPSFVSKDKSIVDKIQLPKSRPTYLPGYHYFMKNNDLNNRRMVYLRARQRYKQAVSGKVKSTTLPPQVFERKNINVELKTWTQSTTTASITYSKVEPTKANELQETDSKLGYIRKYLRPPIYKQMVNLTDIENALTNFDLFNRTSYFFGGDFLNLDLPPPNPKWPTDSGLTHDRALIICSNTLMSTEVARVCSEHLREQIRDAIDVCVSDLQLKDDQTWKVFSSALMEIQCEREIWRKRFTMSPGSIFPPIRVRNALNCLKGCSNQGVCTERGCRCNKGYSGFDCSQANTFTLENTGRCDTSSTNCSSVVIQSVQAIQQGMQCFTFPLALENGSWQELRDKGKMSSAVFVSGTTIQCPLLQTDVLETTETDGWAVQLHSAFGDPVSDVMSGVFYDSKCQLCTGPPPSICALKMGFCLIKGKCYENGQLDPNDACQRCIPQRNTRQWSFITDNQIPIVETPKTLSAFEGELLTYKLKAQDPEGSRLQFTSMSRDLNVTDDGVITWLAVSNALDRTPSEAKFKIHVSDECDGTVMMTLTIIVDKCNCKNGGVCKRNQEIICKCPSGFEGPRCEIVVNGCASHPCLNGQCRKTRTSPGFRCICKTGYKGSRCETEVNPCDPSPCYPGVTCLPTRGWYVCGPCPKGLIGNGKFCQDPDDCVSSPCYPGVACTDLKAPERGYKCGICPPGFTGNGKVCREAEGGLIDVAYAEQRVVCDPPCKGNRQCGQGNQCVCKAGYTGKRCQLADCKPKCLNRGVCVRPGVCRCLQGYSGARCEQPICKQRCEFGGRCIAHNYCSCPYGYVGPKCETMVCKIQCHNGGICLHPNTCLCREGYIGPMCTVPVCKPICKNGGVCVKPGVCKCPAGYFGDRCQRAYCKPACRNGGHCRRQNKCVCPSGYIGSRCQIPVCVPKCANGGRCVAHNMCSCPTGWRGKGCREAICLSHCQNGGVCMRPNTCFCPWGYMGTLCQTPISLVK